MTRQKTQLAEDDFFYKPFWLDLSHFDSTYRIWQESFQKPHNYIRDLARAGILYNYDDNSDFD